MLSSNSYSIHILQREENPPHLNPCNEHSDYILTVMTGVEETEDDQMKLLLFF